MRTLRLKHAKLTGELVNHGPQSGTKDVSWVAGTE